MDTDKLILCQPDCGEMALEVVDQLVRSSAVDIIVVDSVAALTPRAEIEGEIGAIQGARAPPPPHPPTQPTHTRALLLLAILSHATRSLFPHSGDMTI